MSKFNDDARKGPRSGRFEAPSQHDDDFGSDIHEKMSKHTSQEIRREVIKSSSIIQSRAGIDDVKRSFLEKPQDSAHQKRPTQSPIPPRTGGATSAGGAGGNSYSSRQPTDTGTRGASPKFEESSTTRRLVREEKSSSSAAAGLRGGTPVELSPAFKSLQDRIDAFKREFENIENRVSHRSDSSKVSKRTTNLENSSNVEYVTPRTPNNGSTFGGSSNVLGPSYYRDSSTSLPRRPETTPPTSSTRRVDVPKASIKSLSEKFETLGRDDGEDFRRQTEAKRREFFNQIKSQVRETRKELDNFDPIDDDGDEVADRIERKLREKLGRSSYQSLGAGYPSGTKPASETAPPTATTTAAATTTTTSTTTSASRSSQSPSSRPLSRLSGDGASPYQISKPKMFTKRETTQEKVISRVVRENDRIVKDETKRNVERSSSFHGSSDEEARDDAVKNVFGEPNIIRYIDHELRSSPQSVLRTESPVDRLRRETPVVEPVIRGSGLIARTLYDYEAAERDELSFDADDLITNIEKIDKGWYRGAITYKDGSKRVGLFPANYVKLLNDSSDY